jgi:hypothetical protein
MIDAEYLATYFEIRSPCDQRAVYEPENVFTSATSN